MYVIVMHKHSFTTFEYLATSISYNAETKIYSIVTAQGNASYSKEDYLIALMN